MAMPTAQELTDELSRPGHLPQADRRVSDFYKLMYPEELILVGREQDITDYASRLNKILYRHGTAYEEKPVLDVFATERYTAEGAWAHTEPQRGVICILPYELRDYRLQIMKHEILHNAYPGAPEGLIHKLETNPSYDIVTKRFELRYHA